MKRANRGFTLVEILIVVIILGIIAAIVLPKFSNASATARASMMADDLRIVRTQLTIFRSQHNCVGAGYAGLDTSAPPDEATFIKHMTMSSKASGAVEAPGTAGYKFGPYLREVPANPINGMSTVGIVADGAAFPAVADGLYGWLYQGDTQLFKADSKGADEFYRAYIDY